MALRTGRTNGVILTGKRTAHDQFLKFAGVDNKALIDIDGKAMIQHVIDALNESVSKVKLPLLSGRRR